MSAGAETIINKTDLFTIERRLLAKDAQRHIMK